MAISSHDLIEVLKDAQYANWMQDKEAAQDRLYWAARTIEEPDVVIPPMKIKWGGSFGFGKFTGSFF